MNSHSEFVSMRLTPVELKLLKAAAKESVEKPSAFARRATMTLARAIFAEDVHDPESMTTAIVGATIDTARPLQILRLNDVRAKTGLARSTIYAYVSEKRFPAPIPLGSPHVVGWLASEIEDWIAARVRESRPAPTFPHVDCCSRCPSRDRAYAAKWERADGKDGYRAEYRCDRGHVWRTYWANTIRLTAEEIAGAIGGGDES